MKFLVWLISSVNVYFPNQQRWLEMAPAWARDKWPTFHEACQKWCQQNRIPITVTDDAHFYEEK
jgi:hypothetical protein